MVLITGASRGLGKILLNEFIKNKILVSGTYQNSIPDGVETEYLERVDVTQCQSVDGWINKFSKQLKLEGATLIHCAGITYNSFLHKADSDEWAKVINVNLVGAFNVTKAVMPFLREANFGRVIFISSVVAQTGIAGTTAYAASKAGLWGLAKSLSKECKGKNITVNTINLGYFNAGMIDQVPQTLQDEIKSKIPAGNFGDPAELVKLINYIIQSNYVNGSEFDINGGLF